MTEALPPGSGIPPWIRYGVVSGAFAFAVTLAASLVILVVRPADLCRGRSRHCSAGRPGRLHRLPVFCRRRRLRHRSCHRPARPGGALRAGGGRGRRLRAARVPPIYRSDAAALRATQRGLPSHEWFRRRRLLIPTGNHPTGLHSGDAAARRGGAHPATRRVQLLSDRRSGIACLFRVDGDSAPDDRTAGHGWLRDGIRHRCRRGRRNRWRCQAALAQLVRRRPLRADA